MARKYEFTHAQKFALWTVYDGHCFYCKHPVDFDQMTVDHVVPEHLLGDVETLAAVLADYHLDLTFKVNDYPNWVPCHGSCNRRKAGELFSANAAVFYLAQARRKSDLVRQLAEKLWRGKKSDKMLGAVIAALEAGTLRDAQIDLMLDSIGLSIAEVTEQMGVILQSTPDEPGAEPIRITPPNFLKQLLGSPQPGELSIPEGLVPNTVADEELIKEYAARLRLHLVQALFRDAPDIVCLDPRGDFDKRNTRNAQNTLARAALAGNEDANLAIDRALTVLSQRQNWDPNVVAGRTGYRRQRLHTWALRAALDALLTWQDKTVRQCLSYRGGSMFEGRGKRDREQCNSLSEPGSSFCKKHRPAHAS